MSTGVQFNTPPTNLIPDLQHSINNALSALPQDKSGALIILATEKGANAAVVARVNDTWSVQAWVGKSWGEKSIDAGAQVMASW